VNCRYDVVFVLDDSQSIHSHNSRAYDEMIQFVRRVVNNSLDIGPQKSLVGVMFFAGKHYHKFQFGLNNHTNKADLLNAIDDLQPQMRSGTRFVPVLQLLKSSENDQSLGFRPGFPKIAVLVTDGITPNNRAEELMMTAEQFHNQSNFTLFVVGVVGNHGADRDHLRTIAGNDLNVFAIKNITEDTLRGLENTLATQLCGTQSKQNHSMYITTTCA